MTLLITTLHFWQLSLVSLPFPKIFSLTPGRSIRKPPRPPAAPVAQVVGPADAEVVAEEDVAADAADAEAKKMQDLVGMGWRPELASGILSNLDRIDVLEVIA